MRRSIFVLIISCLSSLVLSQISAPAVGVDVGTSGGIGDHKPFWNISNQYGRYSTDPFEGLLGFSLEPADSTDSYLSLDYGFEVYGRLSKASELFIQTAYAEIKIPFLVFWAGRKEEIIGNQDSTLSLGSTVWSRNARPMPKLGLATPGYVDIPFTRGYAEINGSLTHGWLEKDRYVKEVFVHHKQLHVRLGGDFFLNGSLGIIHYAQWGGNSPDTLYGGDLPSGWDAYKRVFFAQKGDSTTVHMNEAINTLGNHLGSWNLRLDVKTREFTSSAYFQSIFEDNSGMINPFEGDGLIGVSLAFKDPGRIVNRILVEYLNTTYQSGPVHNLNDSIKLTGNDNYFNNYIYQSGWTYHGMTLGTPLITSPVFNEDGSEGIRNNRVRAFHLGFGGILGRVNYRTFLTFSINKGTYSVPYDPDRNQFSWYFEAMVPSLWRGIDMTVMFAADMGQMYGNNMGVNLLFRKTFKPFN